MAARCPEVDELSQLRPGLRLPVYLMFFMSGLVALVLEILWARQFVTVFGASSYATTTVLCAFMAGLGIGSLWFGRIADRSRDHLLIYAMIEGGIVVSAALIPVVLAGMRWLAPLIFSSESNLALMSAIRFASSFLILLVPCVLMGGTLPVLSRFCTERLDAVGSRLGVLYGLNTLGAATGCFIAGFWLIETIGLSGTNRLAITVGLVIVLAAFRLRAAHGPDADRTAASTEDAGADATETRKPDEVTAGVRRLLLAIAFVSGFGSLCCEVLWIRYLVFVVPNTQYSFTSILGVYLAGLAVGSLAYRLILAHKRQQLIWLAAIQMAIGPVILVMLLIATEVTVRHGIHFLTRGLFLPEGVSAYRTGALGLAVLTMFLPAVAMGMVFPLICAVFTRSLGTVGRSVGRLYAVNTVGCILGSVAPVAVLVPLFGIERSIFAIAALVSVSGAVVLAVTGRRQRFLRRAPAIAGLLVAFVVLAWLMPGNLTRRLFDTHLLLNGVHQEITFYREGRTATVIILQDNLIDCRSIYINSIQEVPTSYVAHSFFKLFGALGPLLHPDPDRVLALCLGGGIASGTAIQDPNVKSLVGVDLVADMVTACAYFKPENNDLLASEKFDVVIEDARNYLARSSGQYPLIICDSTHPKSPDSWVLYTREFYESVRRALDSDGIFMQWVPYHGLSTGDYRIILKTFQSVFPHTSMWMVDGVSENGSPLGHTLLLATPHTLSIDLESLSSRLSDPSVQKDLKPWNLHQPVDLLETFLCGEETVAKWTDGFPINTDDLPYSQYETSYARGSARCTSATFCEVLESVGPFLANTGNEQQSSELRAQLDRHRQGKSLRLRGRMKEAVALLPECGKMQTVEKNIAAAAQYFRQIAEYSPDDQEALIAVGDHLMMSAKVAVGPESVKEAIQVYKKAVSVDPNHAPAHVRLGNALAATGYLDEAIEHWQQAVSIDPTNAEAHSNLGWAMQRKGDLPESVLHYQQAIDNSWPGVEAEAYCNVASALVTQGKPDKAIDVLRKGMKQVPDVRIAHSLARILATSPRADLRDGAEAVRLLERASKQTDKNLPQILDTLAAAYAEAGRFDRAAQTAQRALQLALRQEEAELAEQIRDRIKLYRNKQPYRESN